MCNGCAKRNECGEGVYALRSGVDGVWKPCLLNHDLNTKFTQLGDWQEQILDQIHAMVGQQVNWDFQEGNPR